MYSGYTNYLNTPTRRRVILWRYMLRADGCFSLEN